jgi:hypothetical protein
MIKMLYYMCEKSKRPLTWPQLEHAIRRNFGGLESKNFNPFQEFEKVINMNRDLPPECPKEVIVTGHCHGLCYSFVGGTSGVALFH